MAGKPGNAILDAANDVSTTIDDDDKRALAMISPLGNRWTTAFDGAGRQYLLIDACGNRTT